MGILKIHPLPTGTKLTQPHIMLATWFGSGCLRPASGTIGTLAALPFGYLIAFFTGWIGLGIAALLLLLIGTFSATHYGEKSGEVDDASIVVDEAVGLWIAGLAAESNLLLWGLAFLLFRLFDIWKPWPASYFDKKIKNGFGVMMDDVVAGIYALFGVSVIAVALMN